MSVLIRRTVILAKIESTYGTDPTPTGSANAIQVSNLQISPLSANKVSRDLIRPYLGNSQELVTDKHIMIDFDVEMAGSGALGVAPAYGPLLRACAMSETITASTKVEYDPVSSGFESLTFYINTGNDAGSSGIFHKITGSRGTVTLDVSNKQIPKFKFKFLGKYNAVTDATVPTPVYTAWQIPQVANNIYTTAFSLFSYAGILESLNIDIGNQVDFRSLIGSEVVQMTDRKTTGTVIIQEPTVATKDFYSLVDSNTNGVITITHGTTTGNKVKIDLPNCDLTGVTHSENLGIRMLNLPFNAVPTNAGNDEFKITIL
jgi:hypothetical protein